MRKYPGEISASAASQQPEGEYPDARQWEAFCNNDDGDGSIGIRIIGGFAGADAAFEYAEQLAARLNQRELPSDAASAEPEGEANLSLRLAQQEEEIGKYKAWTRSVDSWEYESAGYQYMFPSIWGGVVWLDSSSRHNGNEPVGSREIFVKRASPPEIGAGIPPDGAPSMPAQCFADIAAETAHRACCGVEHDPENGKFHGCCVVCGVPWPCETAKYFMRSPVAVPNTGAQSAEVIAERPQCQRCDGTGHLTIYDTATYPGQLCSPIGDEPCPVCSSESEPDETPSPPAAASQENEALVEALRACRDAYETLVCDKAAFIPFSITTKLGIAAGKARAALERLDVLERMRAEAGR